MNMKAVLGLIMGGGQGSRLNPLTKLRAKPAVPLAGKYRLIDIPISNCLHAGIDKIARIGRNVHIRHLPDRPDSETDNWVARDGLVVIPKDAVIDGDMVI